MNKDFYDNLFYEDNLVNMEKQRTLIESYKRAIKRVFGVDLIEEKKTLPIGSLYISQEALEKEKYDLVIEKIRKGDMEIPIPVEEFFYDKYFRVIIDGHVRARARYDIGQRHIECLVLYSDQKYNSHILETAFNLGLKKIYQAPLYYHRIRQNIKK